jgi:SMODS and SLOG-associating 2TM effector domain 6
MTKQDLLKHIADTAYNVGFGAKKHFATYDITAKVPGFIGFISTAVGVFSLVFDSLSTKSLSAAFIVLGIMGICITIYDQKKEKYAEAGSKLTQIFNRLKSLYFNVKAAQETDLLKFEQELDSIEDEYAKIGISDQMLFSGWLAHYKFFWEHQIDWIDEQKHFKFFRDKLPLSFTASAVLALVITVLVIIHWFCKPCL